MTQDIPGTLLLDPKVIEDPYPFYRRLHRHAPVWQVPGTEVFVVGSSPCWRRLPAESRISRRTCLACSTATRTGSHLVCRSVTRLFRR